MTLLCLGTRVAPWTVLAMVGCFGCGALDHGEHVRAQPADGGEPPLDATDDEATAAPDVSTDTAIDAQGQCPEHSIPDGDGCRCEPSYVINSDCSGCVLPTAPNACPAYSYPDQTDCVCKKGFGNGDASQCACVPMYVGAPCAQDTDCYSGGGCVTTIRDFGWVSSPGTDDGIALTGGYCATRWCNSGGNSYNNCIDANGTCVTAYVDVQPEYLCLAPCVSAIQCRDGYTCRKLVPSDMPGDPSDVMTMVDEMYCLPPP